MVYSSPRFFRVGRSYSKRADRRVSVRAARFFGVGIHLTTGIPLRANLTVDYFANGTPQSIMIQGYLVPTSLLSGGS